MKESDWKIFTKIKERALELFCNNVLSEYADIITNKKEKSHETYTYLYRLVINRDKHMALLFDGHSRSSAFLQLIAIRNEGLADEELLNKLSDDFLKKTDPSQIN
ncbi:MAG: hypothetical protein ACC653_08750 [Gammaproteobacteria bacterium]